MTAATRIQALSLGYALDLDVPVRGIVHSVYDRAVNLSVAADLWTVLADDKTDLPLGIRIPVARFDGLGLRRGDTVHVRAGHLGIGSRVVVDCRMARRWMPSEPSEPRPGLKRRLDVVAAAVRGRSWHGSAALAHELRSVCRRMGLLTRPSLAKVGTSECSSEGRVRRPILRQTGLEAVLAGAVGRGPGATPSGDDVLVGVLAVLLSPHSGPAGARTAESFARLLLPLLPGTTDLSGHLLRQAANGWFSRDLEELMDGVLGFGSADELNAAVRRVVETGASSGADACEGLLAFAPTCFTPTYLRTQKEEACR